MKRILLFMLPLFVIACSSSEGDDPGGKEPDPFEELYEEIAGKWVFGGYDNDWIDNPITPRPMGEEIHYLFNEDKILTVYVGGEAREPIPFRLRINKKGNREIYFPDIGYHYAQEYEFNIEFGFMRLYWYFDTIDRHDTMLLLQRIDE